MAKHSKRYNELAKSIDEKVTYALEDAMDIVQKTATSQHGWFHRKCIEADAGS